MVDRDNNLELAGALNLETVEHFVYLGTNKRKMFV